MMLIFKPLSPMIEFLRTIYNMFYTFYPYLIAEMHHIIYLFSYRGSIFTKDLQLRVFRIFLDLSVNSFASILHPKQKGKLPAITNELLLISATELSCKIRKGEIKSEDVFRAYIDRIKTVQPYINAIVDERFFGAVLEAIKLDKEIEMENEMSENKDGSNKIKIGLINGARNEMPMPGNPLLGIPLTANDWIGVKGLAFDGALVSHKSEETDKDAPVVKALRATGAIPITLTNIPETLMWYDSSNLLYGRTNNPYDLSRIPGQSSGGLAALISSSASLIGVGSDIGGSIRISSFCCGIFGHKPSAGIVATDARFPLMSQENVHILCTGLMTRYASDLIPMYKVMAGSNVDKLKLDEYVDFSKIKVYFMLDDENPFNMRVRNEIKMAIKRVVSHLEIKFGTRIEEHKFEMLAHGYFIWAFSQANPRFDPLPKVSKSALLLELIKYFFYLSEHSLRLILFALVEKLMPIPASSIGQKYTRMGRDLKREFREVIGNDGVFIFPTHPEPAPKHSTTIAKFSNFSYTAVFNTIGSPVTACPVGLNQEGLPIGVQVAATPYNDHLTLAVAKEIELAFGGWISPSEVACREITKIAISSENLIRKQRNNSIFN